MRGLNLQSPEKSGAVCEEVEIRGHIIDSLILPKILDCILNSGGTFRIGRITIGQARHDPSYALVEVRAESRATLERILAQIADHGAVPTATQDCHLTPADIEGAFPEGFYSTTNQRTEVRLAGEWVPVLDQEMDCGIVVEKPRGPLCPDERSPPRRCRRGGACRSTGVPRGTLARPADVRLHGQQCLDGKAQGHRHAGDCQGACPSSVGGRKDLVRGRPGDHPHRQRRVSCNN